MPLEAGDELAFQVLECLQHSAADRQQFDGGFGRVLQMIEQLIKVQFAV